MKAEELELLKELVGVALAEAKDEAASDSAWVAAATSKLEKKREYAKHWNIALFEEDKRKAEANLEFSLNRLALLRSTLASLEALG